MVFKKDKMKNVLTLIPAIDLMDGRCVRLTQGAYNTKKVYSMDPLEQAKLFEDVGLKRLHLVDLDGAQQGRVVNWPVLEKIKKHTGLVVDFGGGIRSNDDVQKVVEAGADFFTIGSIAVKNPSLVENWLQSFGADKIILGSDVKNERIAIHGWQEQSSWTVFELIAFYLPKGIKTVICTDVSRDGMLQGPNIELYRKLRKRYPDLHIIASGGVQGIEDFKALEQVGVDGVIFGKAYYEGRIRLELLREQR